MRPPNANQPAKMNERLVLLDALRGFALFGILFVNLTWFSGYAVLSIEEKLGLGTARLDAVVNWLIHFLVEGKFWSLFAFLFGLGAAVQVSRAIQRGVDFGRFFARRIMVLLVIGLAHAVFIWFGDIVSLYAVVGFALLVFVRRSDRVVLSWSLVFLALPIVQGGICLLVHQAMRTASGSGVDPGHGPVDLLASFGGGTYVEAFAANWAFLKERWFLALYEGRFFKLLGMFLLGYWAGRHGVLHRPQKHRRLLLYVLAGGLLVGVPSNAISAWVAETVSLRPPSFAGWTAGIARSIGFPTLCLAYVAAFALFFGVGGRSRRVELFVATGRMSLTNYVAQSAIGVALFYGYGFGLWGRVGTTWLVVLVAIIFGAQAYCSALWLRAFRFGPLEWVWRCLTYRQRVPLRRDIPRIIGNTRAARLGGGS